MKWKDDALTGALIRSEKGGDCCVRYRNGVGVVCEGVTIPGKYPERDVFVFPTAVGKVYHIIPHVPWTHQFIGV